MATCSLCGKEELCFTCPYCNGIYCGEHRLPESHGCPGIHKARENAKKKVSSSLQMDQYEEGNQTWIPVVSKKKEVRRKSKRSRFSTTEMRDLLIASVLVVLVSISIFGAPYGIINGLTSFWYILIGPSWWVAIGMVIIFLLSFMGHELAHKFTAQHYGMWSEFRMTPMGYYLSVIAILFSIPIFGTGIMYTSGTTSKEEDAKSNLAGPLSNFVFAVCLMFLAFAAALFLDPTNLANTMFLVRYGIIINGVLGLFNMIPFQPFDGATVKDWSLPVWIVMTAALLSMVIIGYFVVPLLM